MKKSIHYYLLLLSNSEIRLFEGFREHIFEIREDGFPVNAKSLEFEELLSKADQNLSKFYLQDPASVVLAGRLAMVHAFEKLMTNQNAVAGRLKVDRKPSSHNTLARLAWMILKQKFSYQNGHSRQAKFEGETSASGLLAVWGALKNGHTGTVLVEEKYHKPGEIITVNGKNLIHEEVSVLQPIDDAVDAVIELALEMENEVVFLEEGVLPEKDPIVFVKHDHKSLSKN